MFLGKWREIHKDEWLTSNELRLSADVPPGETDLWGGLFLTDERGKFPTAKSLGKILTGADRPLSRLVRTPQRPGQALQGAHLVRRGVGRMSQRYIAKAQTNPANPANPATPRLTCTNRPPKPAGFSRNGQIVNPANPARTSPRCGVYNLALAGFKPRNCGVYKRSSLGHFPRSRYLLRGLQGLRGHFQPYGYIWRASEQPPAGQAPGTAALSRL